MKKIFIFIIFVIVLGLGFLYSNNEQVWKRNVLSYLNNTYTGKFELVNTDKDKNKYTFLFCTDDDNRIQFEVKCWIGGYDTPWGTINFIPQRHYVDNFSEKIIKNTISETEIYDMTNKTIDEIIEFLKIKLNIIQLYIV